MTCDDPSTDPGEISVAALFRRDQRCGPRRLGLYQAGTRKSDPSRANRRWVLAGSGVNVAGVWTPNTGPRTTIIAVPRVFTHHTPVSPASEAVRRWYRTWMGFPVRTENSVMVKPNTLGGAPRWKNGATSLVPSPVMSGIPVMRCLALLCSQPRSALGTGIRVLDASRLPPGAAVSSR